MDAVEFIKERNRMCDSVASCSRCQVYDELKQCDFCTEDPEKLVQIVEQWSKEHPQKTIMQDFFEKFPNAPKSARSVGDYKIPIPCPSDCGYVINGNNKDCGRFNGNCIKCWSRPMEG